MSVIDMRDRELLELAAKAAGIEIEFRNNPDEGGYPCPAETWNGVFQGWWMPLDDDGDALRLAVSLDIDISFSTSSVVLAGANPDRGRWAAMEGDEQKSSATRRAITRAAAEIGRSMPC